MSETTHQQLPEGELADHYQNLSEANQKLVCVAHQAGFKQQGISTRLEVWGRLFAVCNAKLIFKLGLADTITTVRVHPDSVKVVNVLVDQYWIDLTEGGVNG